MVVLLVEVTRYSVYFDRNAFVFWNTLANAGTVWLR